MFFFSDIRNLKDNQGRSINLALSHRGRKALSQVGLEEKILKSGVPVYGRRLHSIDCKQSSVPYDANKNNVSNKYIYYWLFRVSDKNIRKF